MMRLGTILLAAGLMTLLGTQQGASAESQASAPDFKEVYDLVRTHLAGVNETELNRTAVEALVSALSPKVSLVGGNSGAAVTNAETSLVTKSNLFDGPIGYVRIGKVGDGLPAAVREACRQAGGTNKLTGLVLDLRYSSGQDYDAAAQTADLFLAKERPLLDWGKGVVRSKEKSDAIAMPVAVLVNRQTSGAAEALAAVLRETGAGLVLGSRTAGEAMLAQEYPLQNGQRLRVATTPVKVGENMSLTVQGLKPDIAVEVNPQDERAYYADAFKEIPRNNGLPGANVAAATQSGTTNRTRRPRFNEAELVRERRNGVSFETEVTATDPEAEKPVVRDPTLARALDFLKGLAVVRQTRS